MSTIDEIRKIVVESGNSFHCKVTNYLRDGGWHTLISPYYMDSSLNKPREIDLIAEKEYKYADQWNRKHGSINVRLFIECKYIPHKTVFWFDDKDMESAKKWVTTNSSLPVNNVYTDKHHYLSTESTVAKLFSGETKKNPENEPIYKALNQCLNSMVYNRWRGSIIPRNPRYIYNELDTVIYPVILCNSFENFFRVNMNDQSDPYQIKDNFQLEVNYAYLDFNKNHRTDYFLIDIIDFNKLDSFISDIDSDVELIKQLL